MERSNSTDGNGGLLDDILAMYGTAEPTMHGHAEPTMHGIAEPTMHGHEPDPLAIPESIAATMGDHDDVADTRDSDAVFALEVRQSLGTTGETPTVTSSTNQPSASVDSHHTHFIVGEPTWQVDAPPIDEALAVQSRVGAMRTEPRSMNTAPVPAGSQRDRAPSGELQSNIGVIVGGGLLLIAVVLAVLLAFG